MTEYGFRLYTAGLRRGDGRKGEPFVQRGTNAAWTAAGYFEAMLRAHIDERVEGLPHPPAPDGGEDGPEGTATATRRDEPVYYVESVERVGKHIFFKVRFGRPGGHDLATSPLGRDHDKDIKGLQPTRSYFGCLLVPEGDDATAGILALEQVRTTCPVNYVQRWLRSWATAAPQPAPDGTGDAWWKLVLRPLSDDEVLRRYLERMKPRELILTRHAERRDRQSETEEIRLTASLGTNAAKRRTRKELKEWVRARQEEEPLDPGDAALAVAAILGEEVAGVGFDEVAIRVEDEDFGRRVIKPNQMSDVFVYRSDSETAPTADEFRGRVRRAVSRVVYEGKPDFDWTGWPAARR